MAGKTQIVEELGEKELLLPNLVNAALTANDRAKYLMTLLQMAKNQVDHPDLGSPDLKPERLACGIADSDFDSIVGRSRSEADGVYRIPGVQRVRDWIVENIREMLVPLQVRDMIVSPNGSTQAPGYEQRLETLVAEAPPLAEDRISGASIDGITAARRVERDSLHLLIMDLHQELNQLQRQIATESIDGVSVYGIREGDRPLIVAFASGVNRTKGLKFDHPGLGTTATRTGDRLVIQNDIGLTEAHVLVVHREPPKATVTYTDVHLERVLFFQGLLARFAVRWEDTHSKRAPGLADELYHLSVGTYVARDQADLEEYLDFLGSRLVFLIDWNRARKRLRKFAPKRIGLEVLRWAADRNYGHMGFLTLGGEQLIYDALQVVGKAPLQPGRQLSDILGPERVAEFLKFTLKTAAEGLRAGRSEFLIRDEIGAELRHYIDTAHQGLLEIAAEHATLLVELAMAARDGLLVALPSRDREYLRRTARRAKRWEHRADELVTKGRTARRRWEDAEAIPELLQVADDVADQLEEAVFLLTLLADVDAADHLFVSLQDLAALVVQGAQEYLKAVENARQTHRGSARQQVEDFLEAVDRTITNEHQTDEAHRRAQACIPTFSGDFKQLHLLIAIADHLEQAADALMRSVLALRDYILGRVITR